MTEAEDIRREIRLLDETPWIPEFRDRQQTLIDGYIIVLSEIGKRDMSLLYDLQKRIQEMLPVVESLLDDDTYAFRYVRLILQEWAVWTVLKGEVAKWTS